MHALLRQPDPPVGSVSTRRNRSDVFQRDDDKTDTYLGAEGDVRALGIGLKWLQEDRLARLHDRLQESWTVSAETWLIVLDHLADTPSAEHGELARRTRCTPDQFQRRN